jgi:hypothetical protein
MIVLFLNKVNNNIFDAMEGFLVEKIKGVVGSREMAIHTVGDKALGIIYMGGCFPGVVSILYFVTGGTKLRGRCSHHSVISDAE